MNYRKNGNMNAYIELYEAATALVSALDKGAEKLLPQEIVDVVKLHSKLAVGSAMIPVPGADVVAGAANIWGMYIRINSKIGLSVKENVIKTISSGVATNLASYAAMVGVGSAIKAIPGIGTITGTALIAASLYAITLCAGYVYLQALTLLAKRNGSNFNPSDISNAIDEVLKHKDVIRNFINTAKKDYKKEENAEINSIT